MNHSSAASPVVGSANYLQILLKIAFALAQGILTAHCLAAPPVSPQVAIVVKLYHDFAYEAVIEEPQGGATFLDSSPALLEKYLTPTLAKLILKDRQCQIETHGVCRLDWLPHWDGQDPAGTTVSIKAGDSASKSAIKGADKGTNTVLVELRGQGQARSSLIYTVKHLAQGWRIDDISYPERDATLVKTLTAPP